MSKFISKNWPIFILIFLTLLFFAKLFVPEGRILVTPEFGMSDLWHQNLPYRFLLKESLSAGRLPLWTDKIGMGFPLFAEGQVAALSLINLIPTLIFPAAISFNISFVLIFLLLSIGIYLYAREIGISRVGCLLAAITFTFSAKVVTQLNHPNILLTFAYFPISLYLLERYLKNKGVVNLLFLSFSFSQQIFSGHIQMAFYSGLVFLAYFFLRIVTINRNSRENSFGINWFLRSFGLLLAVLVLAMGISAVQLLPSFEFIQQSNRAAGVAEEIDAFPFRLKHMALFLRPDFFGTPADASYPLDASSEGLFWENAVYIGLVPLILAMFAFLITALQKDFFEKGFFVLLFFFSLALSLGKSNPFFFIFKLPLMNFFRIPPRFLFFTVFSLAILAGFGLDALTKILSTRKFPFPSFRSSIPLSFYPSILLSLLTIIDLGSFGFNYHPTAKMSDWLETPPPTAEFIKKQDSSARLIDIGTDPLWNNIFWHQGWEGQLEQYKNLRNSLFTNSSVYYSLPSAGVYSGVQLKRLDELFTALKKDIAVSQGGVYLFSDHATSLLGALNIKYLISPVQIKSATLRNVFQTQVSAPLANFAVFENLNILPRVRFVNKIQRVGSQEEAATILNNQNFDPSVQAVVEGEIKDLGDLSKIGKIVNIDASSHKISFNTDAGTDSYLLFADTFYPGWKAYVNGEETEVFPSNVNQRLVVVPTGAHGVEFRYQPGSFRVGMIVSVVSLVIWGGLVWVLRSQRNKVL